MNDAKPIPTTPSELGYNRHPNVRAAMQEDNQLIDENESGIWSVTDGIIKDKILHTLGMYPTISRAMLQVGIGTSIPPQMWGPILERLVQEKLVHVSQVQAQSPGGRVQTYTKISLITQKAPA